MMAQSNTPRFVKGICSIIFPREMPLTEQFRQAKAAGFDAIEIRFGDEIAYETPSDKVKAVGDAARKTGIMVASLWVSEGRGMPPLNSDDPAVRAKALASIQKGIQDAALLGCGAILLVPARLGAGPKFQYGYQETWDRVTEGLKKVVPVARDKKVILTMENVWNKFLLSPLEMKAFVDQFHSPWLQVHFDVGNIMQYGYPQDWILTLGPRIKRVHLKDYKLSSRAEQGHFVSLLEGDVDWKQVMAAFVKVGYRGPMSPEYGYDPQKPDQLRQLSAIVDKIFAMA
jgi:L-ribulose-5-phosphate 3-epimerase